MNWSIIMRQKFRIMGQNNEKKLIQGKQAPDTKNGEIRILTDPKEKQRTRMLYEEAFDDSKVFVDYYYDEKCIDNIIITEQDAGDIISMCHMNPYQLMIKGQMIQTYYLVAVATKQTRRHEGHMTRVLLAAFDKMNREGIPFCYLLPAEEEIYAWMGFDRICDFRADAEDDEEQIRSKYDIYCVRDSIYKRRHEIEKKLSACDEGEVLPEHPVIMAKIINLASFILMSGLKMDATEKDCLTWLKQQKIYICEEV